MMALNHIKCVLYSKEIACKTKNSSAFKCIALHRSASSERVKTQMLTMSGRSRHGTFGLRNQIRVEGVSSKKEEHAMEEKEEGVVEEDGEEVNESGDLGFVIQKMKKNTRRIHAAVEILAPASTVYGLLTSYDTLADFIPGLVENTVEEVYERGVKLRQVAKQTLAFGASLEVTAILNITERPDGVTEDEMIDLDISAVVPVTCLPQTASQDICFTLVESRDLKEFTGTWRIQQIEGSETSTRLSYAAQVRPQPWLPVNLIQNRIRREIEDNLKAVRNEAERVYNLDLCPQSS